MGRPAKVEFANFTEVVALEGATAILKSEKDSTIASFIDRFRKRVTIEASDETLFAAKVRAALDTLASQGKLVIAGESVKAIAGKRGRPKGSVKAPAATEATA